MKIKVFGCLVCLMICSLSSSAQLFQQKGKFTRADSLRGNLTPLRTCYDINYYHLNLKLDIANKYITGSNDFHFTATQDFTRLQFDLFENLELGKIIYRGKELPFKREFNAVFVTFPRVIKKGTKDQFTVFYEGNPKIAKRAPWDAGFVFSESADKKPWVAVACQGIGASLWWPNKDHQSDEVDSMLISISVPKGVIDVSNGRLRSTDTLADGYTQYNWFVSRPINNYNVSLNAADYSHFSDEYNGLGGKLSLDYYVLPENLIKAKKQFEEDVKPMFKCFEYWFGPYPFYQDGYKLIDVPYLGMEHQSAVAYGNKYRKGYLGIDRSATGHGLKWDFIIIHETAHEWFGNNITSKDLADMWIHEAFATYAEGLYTEALEGKQAGIEYLSGIRRTIANDGPIIGAYNVNKEGSGDMYSKGANMLHILRTLINDDTKWRSILTGLNRDFRFKTCTSKQIIDYINLKSGKNFSLIFNQYLNFANIPVLEIKNGQNNVISYRWRAEAESFDMPLQIKFYPEASWKVIRPTKQWQTMTLPKNGTLIVDMLDFYIKTEIL